MSGDAETQSGWTLPAYIVHNEALRRSEAKFQEERDRRYTEVKNAEEKALKIKETADRDALQLARDIQTYKDEKANELRSQIERERGSYATQSDLKAAVEKFEAVIAPLVVYVSSQQGRQSGIGLTANVAATLAALILTVAGLVVAAYFATH